MSSNGQPVVEQLLTTVRRWIVYFGGGSFWPLNNALPDAERPADNQEEEELRGVDLNNIDGLQEAQVEPRGGNREGEREENARPPSPPVQQLPPPPPPNHEMEWQQVPLPVCYPDPYPVHYPVPYAVPFAVPHPVPYPFPQAFPFVDPYAFAYPYAFPNAAPTFPHAFPFADPYGFPDPVPYADPDGAPEQLIAMYWHGQPEQDIYYDVFEHEDEDGFQIPQLGVLNDSFVENIGPLSPEGSFEEFSFSGSFSSFSGNHESPSTSGLSFSTRRRREESDAEEAAAKRPRWSDESDSE